MLLYKIASTVLLSMIKISVPVTGSNSPSLENIKKMNDYRSLQDYGCLWGGIKRFQIIKASLLIVVNIFRIVSPFMG